MNILCLKAGDKYDHTYVNRLYAMCTKHFDNFDFHCITENSQGINKQIHIIPIPDTNLFKWWHKMWFFNEEWMTLDDVLFLDLDMIIQDKWKIEWHDQISYLHCDWLDLKRQHQDVMGNRYAYCDINSSILTWRKSTPRHAVWEDFCRFKERVISLYKATDNYMVNRHHKHYTCMDSSFVHSYWHQNCTTSNKPVILFDGGKKQHELEEPWIHSQWTE